MSYDTYLKVPVEYVSELEALINSSKQIYGISDGANGVKGAVALAVGPIQGIAATDDTPAVGDPAYCYAFFRHIMPVGATGHIEDCDTEEGISICGC